MIRGLIFGRAMGAFEEAEAANKLCTFDIVTCCGRSGYAWPGRVDHWCTWHPNLLPMLVQKRKDAGYEPVGKFWSGIHRGMKQGANHLKSYKPGVSPMPALEWVKCDGGSSGLLAIMVNLTLADKIVLAGIPLDPEREHFDKPGIWTDGKNYRKTWERNKPLFQDKVRSMSGWTAELLGMPTEEWLNAPSIAQSVA